MRNTIQIIITVFVLCAFGLAQDFGSYPLKINEPQLSTPNSSFTLLDPDRFQVRQGFSMSMIQSGKYSFGVGAYSNEMSYLFSNNLKLNAGFTYMVPSGGSPYNRLQPLSNSLYYSASLEYKPTENSFFQLRIQNYPRYFNQSHQPFNLNIEP